MQTHPVDDMNVGVEPAGDRFTSIDGIPEVIHSRQQGREVCAAIWGEGGAAQRSTLL